MTATFQKISTTREEYVSVLENLKAEAPAPLKKGKKLSKPQQQHLALIDALEARIEVIDAELAVSNSFPAVIGQNDSVLLLLLERPDLQSYR